MRIVSLLPAATEWVALCQMEDHLVGRTHLCDYPEHVVSDVPVVTQLEPDLPADSSGADGAIREHVQRGLSVFEVDLDRLRALEPDLILTQDQCEVCAVSRQQLDGALAEWTGTRPEVFSLRPTTLREVLTEGMRLGRAVGRVETVMEWMGKAETRLRRLRSELGLSKTSDVEAFPTVACIEWMEPLMTGGHWVPDVCEMAGGRAVLAAAGEPSRTVAWEQLREADPDVIVVVPCGFTLEQTHRDWHLLAERPGWREMRAVRAGRVFAVDGRAYFNRPGPRIYRAVELMAAAIHGRDLGFGVGEVESWEMHQQAAEAGEWAR